DLIAVTVALVDDRLGIDLAHARVLVQLDRIGPQAHRAAQVGDLLLLWQEIDHRVGRLDVELGRVGTLHAGDVPGKLGDRDLHAETYPQVGKASLACYLGRRDLALDPSASEPSWDQNPIGALEQRVRATRTIAIGRLRWLRIAVEVLGV